MYEFITFMCLEFLTKQKTGIAHLSHISSLKTIQYQLSNIIHVINDQEISIVFYMLGFAYKHYAKQI